MKILVLYSTPGEECKATEFDVPFAFDPMFQDDRDMVEQFLQDKSCAAPWFILFPPEGVELGVYDGKNNGDPVEIQKGNL